MMKVMEFDSQIIESEKSTEKGDKTPLLRKSVKKKEKHRMGKTITIPFEDREYVLEFDKASVKSAEASGFVLDEIRTKPGTMIPLLFAAAFRKHHRFVKPETVSAIMESLGKKTDLIEKLIEMYAEPVQELFGVEEEEQKNAGWEANW